MCVCGVGGGEFGEGGACRFMVTTKTDALVEKLFELKKRRREAKGADAKNPEIKIPAY